MIMLNNLKIKIFADGADLERFSSAVTGQSPPVSPVQSGDESDNDSTDVDGWIDGESSYDEEDAKVKNGVLYLN